MKNLSYLIQKGLRLPIRLWALLRNYRKHPRNTEDSGKLAYIWACPDFPFGLLRYISSDHYVKDVATDSQLREAGYTVKWIWGKGISNLRPGLVFFGFATQYNILNDPNYTSLQERLYSHFIKQGCTPAPNLRERLFWENKSFMHEEFEKLQINCPKTVLHRGYTELSEEGLGMKFPLLIKEEHSCSSHGVHKVDSFEKLQNIVQTESFQKNNPHLILQELIPMSRDLRVIIAGDQYLLEYWRMKKPGLQKWTTTASMFGSTISFEDFPEQWRDYILQAHKQIGLNASAFDITWRDDDLSTEPIILEVSPAFQPNPPADTAKLGIDYKTYKKQFRLKDSYDQAFVDITFDIQRAYVAEILRSEVEKQPLNDSAVTDSNQQNDDQQSVANQSFH